MHIQSFDKCQLLEQPKTTLLSLSFLDETVRPFVLICPGGGYNHLAFEKEGSAIQDWLQTAGFHTGILSYQVQQIQPEKFLIELEETMNYLKQQTTISEIFVLGFSAGGHVAGLFGTKISTRPDGLVLCYPVVSFSEEYSHSGSWENFLGTDADQLLRKNYSIEKNIDDATPPCFIWHTAEDQAVPMENSLILAQQLKQQQIPVELHIFPEGRHGLGILDEVPHVLQWKQLAIHWLQKISLMKK